MDKKELAMALKDMSDEEILALIRESRTLMPQHTGYERVDGNEEFFCVTGLGDLDDLYENDNSSCTEFYNNANYYSDINIARDNIRADLLMRRLRRLAAEENALVPPCKQKDNNDYWSIGYYAIDGDYSALELMPIGGQEVQNFGEIRFKTEAAATRAIEEFYDELIWYFTTYMPIKG